MLGFAEVPVMLMDPPGVAVIDCTPVADVVALMRPSAAMVTLSPAYTPPMLLAAPVPAGWRNSVTAPVVPPPPNPVPTPTPVMVPPDPVAFSVPSGATVQPTPGLTPPINVDVAGRRVSAPLGARLRPLLALAGTIIEPKTELVAAKAEIE
jgi:hypothetical protein